jgi:hypothetical protein
MLIKIEQISDDGLSKEVYWFSLREDFKLRCYSCGLYERRTKRCKFKEPVRWLDKKPSQDIINLALEKVKSIEYID